MGEADADGEGEGFSAVGLNANAFDSAVKLQRCTFATCGVYISSMSKEPIWLGDKFGGLEKAQDVPTTTPLEL